MIDVAFVVAVDDVNFVEFGNPVAYIVIAVDDVV